MKGRALRRALATTDAGRVGGPTGLPLIVDTTELVTPELAYELLLKNAHNRPINWAKVEEYAAIMARGGWELHAQGIVLDVDSNILTGQKRLWAVIYSGASVYMRISRGNPPSAARVLDRGTPQSARDLAARETGRKHSPIEQNLARALLGLKGDLRPSTDALAETLTRYSAPIAALIRKTTGTKKTRAVLMVMAAIIASVASDDELARLAHFTEALANSLTDHLAPQTPEACWARGTAFGLALEDARRIVEMAIPA